MPENVADSDFVRVMVLDFGAVAERLPVRETAAELLSMSVAVGVWMRVCEGVATSVLLMLISLDIVRELLLRDSVFDEVCSADELIVSVRSFETVLDDESVAEAAPDKETDSVNETDMVEEVVLLAVPISFEAETESVRGDVTEEEIVSDRGWGDHDLVLDIEREIVSTVELRICESLKVSDLIVMVPERVASAVSVLLPVCRGWDKVFVIVLPSPIDIDEASTTNTNHVTRTSMRGH